MMHDRFDSLVDLLVVRGLDEPERREAESHAASCSPCGALLLEARSFHAWATGAIAPDAPPADLADRLIARFRAAKGVKPRRSWPRIGRALKIVGCLAAAAFLIVLGASFTAPHGEALIDSLTQAAKAGETDNATQVGMNFRDADNKMRPESLSFGRTRGAIEDTRALDRLSRAPNTWGFGANRRLGATKEDTSVVEIVTDGVSLDARTGLVRSGTATLHEGLEFFAKDGKTLGADQLALLLEKSNESLSGERFPGVDLGLGAVAGISGVSPNAPMPAPVAPDAPAKPEMRQAEDLKVDLRDLDNRLAAAYPPEPIQAGRKLIRNADVSVEVESYDAALAKINAIVTEEKGFVSSADTERMANGKISATVTLRIPPERFEAVVERFRALGTVRHQSITTQDVTKAYVDLESRLSSKQSLMDRLKKVLAEAKGTVKELMEVEVQMGKTLEDLEAIKGELKYYDNLVGLSTIILRLAEKDLGQPFEVVQTLQSAIGITSAETEAAYVRAQKAVADAGGQVIDSNLVRSKDGSAKGTIRAKVDAEKFPALREELRKLGHVDVDTVVDRKTARGGQEGPAKPDAPVRKEQAVITLSIVTPPIHVARRAQLAVETRDVEGAYLAARKSVEAAGGKVLGGSVTGRTDGMSASLAVQVETGNFVAVLDGFRTAGKVLHSTSSQAVPPAEGALVREKGEIEFALSSPPLLIGEEHGLGKTVRDTFSGSVAGLLWSVEKLFVGVSLAGPWLALALGGWLVWRRVRRKKAAQTAA